MPGGRCGVVRHGDIASNRLLAHSWWQGPQNRSLLCKLPSVE